MPDDGFGDLDRPRQEPDGEQPGDQQEQRPNVAGSYKSTGMGLYLLKEVKTKEKGEDGTTTNRTREEEVRLTNFDARIVADVRIDDGAEVRHMREMTGMLAGRPTRFSIPAERFPSMNWAAEHLGSGAIVQPGFGLRDHARAAVQYLSVKDGIAVRHVYTHTGWRQLPGGIGYMTASRAMMAAGLDESVTL